MVETLYKALIVDDEVLLRSLVSRALTKEGFACDVAEDGIAAQTWLRDTTYDIIITDLRMPRLNGHTLACEVLAQQTRPVLIVLTGVIEPRLAKDLLSRGVDDIAFKPVDYGTFAAKARGLVNRRLLATPKPNDRHSRNSESQGADEDSISCPAQSSGEKSADTSEAAIKVGATQKIFGQVLQDRLSNVGTVLSIPNSILDVYRLASTMEIDGKQLANAIAKHEVLKKEVVRLANSRFYNRASTKITHLDGAVVQIGRKRIGQLALAANAIAALAPNNPDCLGSGSSWPRSVAAGLAVELLVKQGNHRKIEDGLLLCATMHSVGRLVLASLFPKQYEAAVKECIDRNESLTVVEHRLFPHSQSDVMHSVLTTWGIEVEPALPLRYVSGDYESTAKLDEPLRSKTQLVKLAHFVAQIALGHCESWDTIEVPPEQIVSRLGINSLESIIKEVEDNVKGINAFEIKKLSEDS